MWVVRLTGAGAADGQDGVVTLGSQVVGTQVPMVMLGSRIGQFQQFDKIVVEFHKCTCMWN